MKNRVLFLFLCFCTFAISQHQQSYVIKEGDSLESIAKIYRLSPRDIKKNNPEIKTNGFRKGMTLLIPVSKINYYNTKMPVKFGIHTVKEKETLFGIAHTYNITQDDLRRYNIELQTKTLLKGMELTIPFFKADNTKIKPQENPELAVYVVKPKEGKWRIAQRHSMSVAELEALNPSLSEPLKEGTEIWIPKSKVIFEEEEDTMVVYQVEKGEGILSLCRKFNMTEQELLDINPSIKQGLNIEDNIMVPRDKFAKYVMSLSRELGEKPMEDHNEYVRARANAANIKQISFVLPFKVAQAKDVAEIRSRLQKDRFTNISSDFYSGALIALDSLQKMGYSFVVNTYDTSGKENMVEFIANSQSIKNSQIVIGPLTPSEFNKLSENLQNPSTAVIAPMSNRNIELRANVFQSLPTQEVQQNAMISFVNRKYPEANIVLLSDGKDKAQSEKLSSSFFNAVVVDEITAIKKVLDRTRPNIVFVNSNDVVYLSDVIRILYNTSQIKSDTEQYNIIMATLDKGSAYDHSSISNVHLSALKFTFPTVNRYSGAMNSFIKKYYNQYKIAPSRYAIRGFDLTMDSVLRCAISGNLISQTPSLGQTSFIENKFAYVRNISKGGGFENKGVYIVRYDDLEIKEIY